jgi:hypothetical protein
MYQFRRDRRFRHCRSADPPVYIFAVWHGLVPDHPCAGTAAAGVVIYPDDAVSSTMPRTTGALISVKSALILNPLSAWGRRDAPLVAADCWTFPAPKGPEFIAWAQDELEGLSAVTPAFHPGQRAVSPPSFAPA